MRLEQARLVQLIGERVKLDLSCVVPTGGGQERTFYACSAGEAVVVKWAWTPTLLRRSPTSLSRFPS